MGYGNLDHRCLIYSIGRGGYTMKDYYQFKDHLRLPMPYLKAIFRSFSRMETAVLNLATVIRKTNDHYWEALMEVGKNEKLYRMVNIPPMFFGNKIVITTKATEQVDFEWLCDHADEAKGEVFYFFSEFSEGAMNAAFTIIKSMIEKNKTCYCSSLPEILAEYKEDWDSNSYLQKKVRDSDIVVIYAVGGEYATDFTQNRLQDIVRLRKINSRVTILCSSLHPKDYAERYKMRPEGVEIGFADKQMKKTLAQLKEELQR